MNAKRIEISTNESGETIQTETPILGPGTEEFDSLVKSEVEAQIGEIRATRAQMRLARMREQGAFETVRRIDIEGDAEPFWIKRGTFPDLATCAALSGRDKNGVLSLQQSESLSGFIAAILRVFCVVGESEGTPYFESLSDARAFVDDPRVADATATLFYGAVAFNPEVWPEGAEQAKNVWAALVAARSAPTDSSPPPFENASEL